MISEKPNWVLSPKQSSIGFFNSYLWEGTVVGSWFRVSLDGNIIWNKACRKANQIFSITDEFIIGTHFSGGGCCGIEAATGELAWSFPKWNFWSKYHPVKIVSDSVMCLDGVQLDIKTGNPSSYGGSLQEESLSPTEETFVRFRKWIRNPEDRSSRCELMNIVFGRDEKAAKNELAKRLCLEHIEPIGFRHNKDGHSNWELSIENAPYLRSLRLWNVCFRYPYIYCVVPKKWHEKPKGIFSIEKASSHRFLAINCKTGKIDQEFELCKICNDCSIEDINETHILFSYPKFSGFLPRKYLALHSLEKMDE